MAGASGYIDGRLVPCLLERGYRVRSLARSPKKLEARGWASEPRIEIVVGDLADTDGLAEQLAGCEAAYYLAHSMLARDSDSPGRDPELAGSFANAVVCAGCERILYLGGPGSDRGRRNVEQIRHGDALDFWRVTGVEHHRSLTLRAEMKVPGEAVLEFRVRPLENIPGMTWLTRIARFKPKGLGGILYWYSVLPFHGIVFRGMVRGIRHAAEKQSQSAPAKRHISS